MLMAKTNVYMNITSTYVHFCHVYICKYLKCVDNFVKNESLLTNVLVADEITRDNYQNNLHIIS